jgi:iron complex outermembrane receptor protein
MPRQEFVFPVADPLRGGAVANVRLVGGGNPNLDVVTARSFTSGFVFTPGDWPEMRFAGTYWRVVMDDRIIVPPFNDILQAEDGFLDRIVRSAPTAEDLSIGRPGPLQSVDLTRLNYGRLETSGIDFDASYLVQTRHGCFNSTLTATWVHDYSSMEINSAFPTNRVGIATTQGTIPEWRVVGGLAWKLNGLGASVTATYTPAYQDSNLIGPIDRRLPSRTLVDVQASLELEALFNGSSLFSQAKLTAGVLNLFDKDPDFAEAGFVAGYDLTQADMTQRFTYLRLSKSF